MKKKIILTGSEGFIGKVLFKHLKKKFIVKKVDLKLGIDLTDEQNVKKFFKKNNDCEYLINLHGLNEHVSKDVNSKKLIKKIHSKKEFDNYFQNNVYSIYLTIENFVKYSKKPKGVINFSSIYSLMSPKHNIYNKPKNIFYVSSKFAVNGLTKYFATLYGKKIRVNSIANHGIIWKQQKSFIKKISKNIPKERLMRIDDLYGIIDLLCSEKSNYINGSVIVLDGGYSSW